MKKDIHPAYKEVTVTCGCGNSFVTRSTAAKIAVEVCASCHPFFTGKQKFIDAAGMVEKFQKKWSSDTAMKMKAAQQPKAPVKKAVVASPGRVQQTLSAQLGAREKKPAPAPAPAAPQAPAAAAPKPAPAAPKAAPPPSPAPKPAPKQA